MCELGYQRRNDPSVIEWDLHVCSKMCKRWWNAIALVALVIRLLSTVWTGASEEEEWPKLALGALVGTSLQWEMEEVCEPGLRSHSLDSAWVFMCVLRCVKDDETTLHWLHLCDFSPVCELGHLRRRNDPSVIESVISSLIHISWSDRAAKHLLPQLNPQSYTTIQTIQCNAKPISMYNSHPMHNHSPQYKLDTSMFYRQYNKRYCS